MTILWAALILLGVGLLLGLGLAIAAKILYVRTPVPKGCENIKINDENCSSCNHKECKFYKGEGE